MATSTGAGAERIEIVPFTPDHMAAVRRFSRSNWRRPLSDGYFAWRYLAPATMSRMVLAMRGDLCVGMLFALRKIYRIAGAPVTCLEVFDWHSLPEVRGSGVGVRLMRAMMREPGWIVSVSGTDDVIKALELMGWTHVGASRLFERPLRPAETNGDPVAEARRAGARVPPARGLAAVLGAFNGRKPVAAPPGAAAARVPALSPDVLNLSEEPSGYAIAQQPDPAVLRWIASGPWAGRFELLEFRSDGRPRGWAMIRIFDWGFGLDGDVVEVFAPRPDAGLYAWMVSEAVAALSRMPLRRIRARASCPVLQAALAANGFLTLGPPTPILVRPGPEGVPAGSVHVTMNHADGPLLPYESDAQIRRRATEPADHRDRTHPA